MMAIDRQSLAQQAFASEFVPTAQPGRSVLDCRISLFDILFSLQ